MSENVLRILLRLFATLAAVDGVTREEKDVVRLFLEDHLNNAEVPRFMELLEEFLSDGKKVDVREYCAGIARELSQKQQFIILLHLLELIHADQHVSEGEVAFLAEVTKAFVLPEEDVELMKAFVGAKTAAHKDVSQLLVASAEPLMIPVQFIRQLEVPLAGQIAVLSLGDGTLYLIKYFGEEYLQLNHQYLAPGKNYVLSHGSVINLPHGNTLYFSDIIRAYLDLAATEQISLTCNDVEYTFPKGNKGLQGVDLAESSGSLVAIMGASGSGKSTLLNVLNGNYAPSSGEVLINGRNVHENLDAVKGLIGYVPQDDLLIEELTVYQNLYFNAKLCHKNMAHKELDELVLKVLDDLGLAETKDLRVGNPLDKTISGGQRKRLNIGLELLRTPAIIFFDEPTSGLSSRDSENIMDLLKELTFKGKLIFVVIHQPSSEIFKMFDSLLILDTGGWPIYYGNPVESVMYFKRVSEQVNHDQATCPECGNINPEQIFNIIETRVIDEFGNPTNKRKIEPQKWSALYREHIGKPPASEERAAAAASGLKTPSWMRQFAVFWKRDLLAKLGNRQNLTINVLQAPLLAFILAILVRHSSEAADMAGSYVFGKNDNMPAFFFMSIVVALFIGMTMSAEEIFRDRKILKRENFLNLSRSGYLLSKTGILFAFSSLQMASFVLIAALTLSMPGLYFHYWLMLFSLGCFAIMLGLNVSATFNSAVTIYILIPLLLIPQLILSGTVVKFDQLNPGFSSPKVVPVAADLMASRWAYEGMMVKFFKDNAYQGEFFESEAKTSEASYRKDYWAPKMTAFTNFCLRHKDEEGDSIQEVWDDHFETVRFELEGQVEKTPKIALACKDKLDQGEFSQEIADCILAYLDQVKKHYIAYGNAARTAHDSIDNVLSEEVGGPLAYRKFKMRHHNEAIDKLVRNADSGTRLLATGGEIVRTYEPIYHEHPPRGLIGYRTHFYAPTKSFFGIRLDTYWFNVIVIWFMTLMLYVTLHYEVFRRILQWFNGLRK